MPISQLEPRELSKLTPQQIADMVLSLDQDRRAYLSMGKRTEAQECAREIDRLAEVFQHA